MGRLRLSILFLMGVCAVAAGQAARFVVDDDEYLDKVTKAGAKLLQKHKLKSVESLRRQVHTKGSTVKLAPLSVQKLSPPDLCDRLRESTLAVGSFYKCPDCGEWHFNSSAGFAV